MRTLVLATMLVLFSVSAVAHDDKVSDIATALMEQGFPPIVAERLARSVVNVERQLPGIEIQDLRRRGNVRAQEIRDVARDMMDRGVVLDGVDGTLRTIHGDELNNALSRDARDRIEESLRVNIGPGDVLFEFVVNDRGQKIRTLCSMHPEGVRFSGLFLGTSRLAGVRVQDSRQNPYCTQRVLTTYLWGSPAEHVKACVDVNCGNNEPSNCRLTEVASFAGFLSKIEVLPKGGAKGEVDGRCCEAVIQWMYVTGFKKIKIGGDGTTLEAEGTIGQQANGFFTLKSCCDRD